LTIGLTLKSMYKIPCLYYFHFKEGIFTHVDLQDKMQLDIEAYLCRRYEGHIADIEIVDKEDLDLVSSHGIYAHILLL